MQATNVLPLDRLERLWSKADKAHVSGMNAYLDFCQALGELNAAGVTQEEIGRRYDMSRSKIARSIRVGNDQRIVRNPNNLPAGTSTLYLLTTLNDIDFQRFAKPETVEHDIRQHKAVKRQAKNSQPDKRGWPQCVVALGVQSTATIGGSRRAAIKQKLEEHLGRAIPSHLTPEQEPEIQRAYIDVFGVEELDEKKARPALSETAEKKLERALAIENKKLQDSFHDAVHKEVVKRLPNVHAEWERATGEASEATMRYAKLANRIEKKITAEEYKFVLGLLHPDRQPEDRREKFARGFQIIMRLKEYAES